MNDEKMPIIKCYAYFERVKNGGKTPKFTITRYCGHYPQLNELTGRDGKVSMYLMESQKSGSKQDAPPMKLQAKNSLNFTGLKDYFVNGRISGYAYGYPYDNATYKYKGTDVTNPFRECRNDAFLFKVHTDEKNADVEAMEMLVLDSAKVLAPAYCKQLMSGGFNDEISQLRFLAKSV